MNKSKRVSGLTGFDRMGIQIVRWGRDFHGLWLIFLSYRSIKFMLSNQITCPYLDTAQSFTGCTLKIFLEQKETNLQMSSVTTIQVTAPCSATNAQAAARAPTMATATRPRYGQLQAVTVTITGMT